MIRKLTLVFLVLAFAIVVWSITSWTAPPLDSTFSEVADDTNQLPQVVAAERTDRPSPATKLPVEQPVGSPTGSTESAVRELLAPPKPTVRFEEIPNDEVILVPVIIASSGAAATGAEVRYLGMSNFAGITKAERARMQKKKWGPDKVLDTFGFSARVDAAGIATVRQDKRGVMVRGKRDDLIGQVIIESRESAPVDGWVIRLRPDCTVRMRVVDSTNAPVPNVPIAIQYSVTYTHGRGQSKTRFQSMGETDSNGERVVPDFELFLKTSGPTRQIEHLRCVLHLPGLTDVGVDIDMANPPRGMQVLALPPTGSVRVEIFEATGKPATGVTYVDLRVANETAYWRSVPKKTTSVPPFAKVALGKRYDLTVHLGRISETTTIDGPTEAGQAVVARIELAATARVVVKLTDGRGQPFTSTNAYVDLVLAGSRKRQERFDDKGRAVFDRVPLGKTFRAVTHRPNVKKEFTGPTRAGEEFILIMVPDASVPILTGRIIDATGQPLTEKRISLGLEFIGGRSGRSVTSDSQGRFQFVIDPRMAAREIQRAILQAVGKNSAAAAGAAELRLPTHLRGGITDLGDIVLAKRPLLLSGYFVGYKPDKMQSPPFVSVERHRTYVVRGKPRDIWRRDRDMRMIRVDDDKFEFRGDAKPGRLRLTVNARGYLKVKPIEFTLGTTDLPIRLVRGGSLRAVVRVDKTIRQDMVRFRLIAKNATPTQAKGLGRETRDYNNSTRLGEVSYRWIGIPPGLYRLEIALPGSSRPLLAVDSIEVVAGQKADDARLKALDLRGQLRLITLTFEDAFGAPLVRSGSAVALIRPPGRLTDLEGQTFTGRSQVTLAISFAPVDVLIAVTGYSVKTVIGVNRDMTVRLDAPYEVRVVLRDGGPSLPEGASLRLSLRPVRADASPRYAKLRYQTNQRSGPLSNLLAGRSQYVTLKGGKAAFSLRSTGRFKVYCQLRGAGRTRYITVDPTTIQVRDTPREQSFKISIPQAALDKADK